MLLPGVIWPNSLLLERSVTYTESESSGLSVALPKYSLPFALASVCKPAVELGVVVAVVVAPPVVVEVLCRCNETNSPD